MKREKKEKNKGTENTRRMTLEVNINTDRKEEYQKQERKREKILGRQIDT